MKKVLILAYDFPPYISVGGLRPYNWFKYFKEFDIEPTIITRQWENKHGNGLDYITESETKKTEVEKSNLGTVYRTPYKPNFANKLLLKYGEKKFRFIRKTISLYYEIAQFFFIVGPKKRIFTEARLRLSEEKFDLILATGDPFVLFHYASKLSDEFKVPWIADYRDPWSFGVDAKYTLHQNWKKRLEKKTMRNVSCITTVNATFFSKLNYLKKAIHSLPNGYDSNFIEKIAKTKKLNSSLTIGLVGTIMEWHPLHSFLSAADLFVKKHGENSLRINLYGINNAIETKHLIDNEFESLKSIVVITPRLANDEVLNRISKSDLLLLFNSYAVMATKIYDYIGLKIPILFCYSEDKEADQLRDKYNAMKDYQGLDFNVQQKLIESKKAGYIVHDFNHLVHLLDELYDEFKKTGGIKSTTENSEELSRRSQTGKLAKLIFELA